REHGYFSSHIAAIPLRAEFDCDQGPGADLAGGCRVVTMSEPGLRRETYLQRLRREHVAHHQFALVAAVADHNSLSLAGRCRGLQSNRLGEDGASVQNGIDVDAIPLAKIRRRTRNAVVINAGARVEGDPHPAAAEDLH